MAIIEPTFDANGLRIPTLEEIKDNLRERVRTNDELGAEVSTGAHSLAGLFIDVIAPAIEDVYGIIQDINDAWDIDAAEGVQLDNLEGIKGTDRDAATSSTVKRLEITGTASTNVPAGTKYGIGADGAQWATDEAAVIGGGGTVEVAATCTVTGPVAAAVGAIETIIDAVAGVDSVTNLDEAEPGSNIETDSEFRTRGEGASVGSTTEEAIYTALVDRDDVEFAVVTSNRSSDYDENGTPPHSYWIVLYPDTGNQQEIAETIWGEVGTAAGIGFRGDDVTATVTDINNEKQVLKWDWADVVNVHVSQSLDVDSSYPASGDDDIKAAIVAYADTLRVGQDVYPAAVNNASYDSTDGIVQITKTLMKVGGTPGPTDTGPVEVALNELADIDTANITITSTVV